MTTWSVRVPGRRAKPRPVAAPVALPAEIAVVTEALTVVAVVCAWVVLQLLVLGGVSHDRAQHVLHAQFRTDLASATAPVGGVIDPGTPVSTLTIPGRGISEVVVEGTASSQTLGGPGHRRDTVLPGQPGTSVLYGRSSTFGAPFGGLDDLRVGDPIMTVTGQGRAAYEVSGLRRAGDPLPQPLAPGAGRLVLVGAEGQGRLAALSPGAVVFVDAELVSKPHEAGAPRVPSVPEAEQPMGRDTSVLPLLALVLAGVAAVVALATYARARLGRARAWVLLSAPLVALAWIATDLGVSLLPNLV
ncbi:sortase [Aeromicrobium choanae]|uniref:Sortase family protein n=1 Tax=Aeromicrobium choanae TaxID=1736691 RepID=A0A1T4Z7P1_9ACTN|nr:sortase [Aeromicrobium choanae]SKB09585.1 Sortase family protein [Aeromicrobium choanae]